MGECVRSRPAVDGRRRQIAFPTDAPAEALDGAAVCQFSDVGAVLTLGVGMRQQVRVRYVLDLGVEADVAGFDAAPSDRLRLVAGYSIGFRADVGFLRLCQRQKRSDGVME